MSRKWSFSMLTTAYLQVNGGSGARVPWKEVAEKVNRVHGTNFSPAATRQAWTRYMEKVTKHG